MSKPMPNAPGTGSAAVAGWRPAVRPALGRPGPGASEDGAAWFTDWLYGQQLIRSSIFRAGTGGRAHLPSTTIAWSRLAGASGTRQREIRQIPVTWATLPLSIPYSRVLRDAIPLAEWTGLVLGLGIGRERAGGGLREARNILGTC